MEEISLEEKARLIIEAQNTNFWLKVFVPEFQQFYEQLDTQGKSELDPWRRYAIVEARKALEEFKLRFDDIVIKSKSATASSSENPEDPEDVEAIISNLDGGYPDNEAPGG